MCFISQGGYTYLKLYFSYILSLLHINVYMSIIDNEKCQFDVGPLWTSLSQETTKI